MILGQLSDLFVKLNNVCALPIQKLRQVQQYVKNKAEAVSTPF